MSKASSKYRLLNHKSQIKIRSFTKRVAARNPIVHEVRHYHAGANDRRQLPWECIRLLTLLDGPDDLADRVVQFHQEWHLGLPTGRQRCLDESWMDNRDINPTIKQIDSYALKKSRHGSFARAICS